MNKLRLIEEFRQVLVDYQLSEKGKDILEATRLVLFVGPSSSGRNTIINELKASGKYHYIVSDTTRQPRVNNGVPEQSGREYWFRSEEEVLDDLRQGLFLEAAIIHNQQVSGISLRELQRANEAGKINMSEIEVVGADNVHKAKPDTLFIFVVPPSFDEWMVRMSTRGELPKDETRRRLESAVEEISVALERDFYHFIVNDTFKQTTPKIERTIEGNPDQVEQIRGREVAAKLLDDTKAYLSQL